MSNKIIITKTTAYFSTRRSAYSVQKSHDYFKEIVEALKEGDTKTAYHWYSSKKENEGSRRVKIKNNELYFDDQKFDPIFAEAYQVAKENGLPFDKLELFFKHLSENPSPISVQAFTAFIAKSRMPITDRGTFLAYKNIGANWTDCRTGKFDNRPDCVLSMPRSSVDSRQDQTCSTGFHACSYEYLDKYPGDICVVVEINPRDVVAVPPDYQRTKMRVASYRVLCSLPYFKEQLLSYQADALGMIPIFNTECMSTWDVMSDVDVTDERSPRTTKMSPTEWLKSRKAE